MANAKFDLKSIEIPAAAQKPIYAYVGAGDLAVAAVKEYIADAQKKLAEVQKDVHSKFEDVQKQISDFDAKKVRENALEQAKARRAAVEARVAELQSDAKAIPETVSSTYDDLAKRGEKVVRGTKLPSSVKLEAKVNTTQPAAKKPSTTREPAVKKAPAKKAPAAKKTATTKA